MVWFIVRTVSKFWRPPFDSDRMTVETTLRGFRVLGSRGARCGYRLFGVDVVVGRGAFLYPYRSCLRSSPPSPTTPTPLVGLECLRTQEPLQGLLEECEEEVQGRRCCRRGPPVVLRSPRPQVYQSTVQFGTRPSFHPLSSLHATPEGEPGCLVGVRVVPSPHHG